MHFENDQTNLETILRMANNVINLNCNKDMEKLLKSNKKIAEESTSEDKDSSEYESELENDEEAAEDQPLTKAVAKKNKQTRVKTSWNLFFEENKDLVKKDSFGDKSRVLSEAWNVLPSSQKEEYKQRAKEMASGLQENIKCKICGKEFSKNKERNRHEKFCGKKYQCRKCNTDFSSITAVKAHIKHVHQGVKKKKEVKISCQVCQKHFSSNYSLKRHKNTFHNI